MAGTWVLQLNMQELRRTAFNEGVKKMREITIKSATHLRIFIFTEFIDKLQLKGKKNCIVLAVPP